VARLKGPIGSMKEAELFYGTLHIHLFGYFCCRISFSHNAQHHKQTDRLRSAKTFLNVE